jgi:hypothetical protein
MLVQQRGPRLVLVVESRRGAERLQQGEDQQQAFQFALLLSARFVMRPWNTACGLRPVTPSLASQGGLARSA